MTGFRRTTELSAVAAVVAAGALIAGCGSSSSSSPRSSASAPASGNVSGSTIERAADVSGAEPGEKMTYTMSENIPSLGTIDVDGSGGFNASPVSGAMRMAFSAPSASGLGAGGAGLNNTTISMVITKNTMYMKYGGALGAEMGKVTHDKPWIAIGIDQVGSAMGVSGLSNLMGGASNPTSEFQTLAEAATNGVRKVGTATINGVPTTEYSATINLAKAAANAPAAKRAALQSLLARFSKEFHGASDVPVDAWIDSSDRIRQYTLTVSPRLDGRTIATTMKLDVLDYGTQPVPAAPPASETYNGSALISAGLSQARSGGA